jgi:hypothetical protein
MKIRSYFLYQLFILTEKKKKKILFIIPLKNLCLFLL